MRVSDVKKVELHGVGAVRAAISELLEAVRCRRVYDYVSSNALIDAILHQFWDRDARNQR